MGIRVGHPKLSLCNKSERNPVGVVRVTAPSVFTSRMAARPPLIIGVHRLTSLGYLNIIKMNR